MKQAKTNRQGVDGSHHKVVVSKHYGLMACFNIGVEGAKTLLVVEALKINSTVAPTTVNLVRNNIGDGGCYGHG